MEYVINDSTTDRQTNGLALKIRSYGNRQLSVHQELFQTFYTWCTADNMTSPTSNLKFAVYDQRSMVAQEIYSQSIFLGLKMILDLVDHAAPWSWLSLNNVPKKFTSLSRFLCAKNQR